MTARQIIDEIKAMSPDERGQVAEFFRQWESAPLEQRTNDDAFDAIAERIFERHAPLMRKLAS